LAQEVSEALTNPDATLVSRVQVFLDGFPRRYLRFTPKQKIGEHFKLAEKVRSPDDLVLKLNRSRSTYELTLVALDRPYLFAKLTGVLSYFGMNIVRGQAFANRQGIVLDMIQFEDRLQTFRLNKSEIDNFRAKLHRILNDQESLTELLRSRENSILLPRKAKRPISTFVSFDDHASEKYSIMEIVTQDRYGLLSKIATVFAQNDCNIDVALISTEGHRAIDVFYLTQNGARLSGQKRERLATLMKETLDQAA
jgi:[protein-PII] uridylyltransferase